MDLPLYGQNGAPIPATFTLSAGIGAATLFAVLIRFSIYLVPTNSLLSGFSSRKESLRYQISATRFASTLTKEQVQDPDDISNRQQPTAPFHVSTTLTPSQTSRAVRQAVILALQNHIGGCEDALHIVNSLHHPILKQDPDAAKLPNVTSYPAITFNQPVSPRLASHALVHGLIRQKKLQRAITLALAMMQCNMRVHTRTLNVIMQSLKPPQGPESNVFKTVLPKGFRPDPKGLGGLAGMAGHASTRLALEIFTVARRTGQGDTRGLFGTLLAICLINSEIVLASFVFVMVVKEFYHPPPSPEGDTTESTWNTERYGPRSLVFLPRWSHFIDLMTPMQKFFQHVTTLNTASVHFDRESLDANLQALAILANLLDLRQLHLPTIASLVTLMYKTPRVDSTVWVLDEAGIAHEVVAFQYFHDVLVRLIESPPPAKTKRSCRAFTPPLGIKTCNALLHYALRHCHSPTLGNKIFIHLTRARRLSPDDATYNILLRSGTLLRNDDLASLALKAIIAKQRPPRHEPESQPKPDIGSPLWALSHSRSELGRHIASVIQTLHSTHLGPLSRNNLARCRHALYTLTTLIMHLCSTGHPYLVKTVIFALFPALNRDLSTPLDQHMVERRKAIRQGAHFGPLLFTVMLNSLVKARAFSEARLLYNFAVAAERRSWFTTKPWTLGTEAYTIMLECCVAECREATRLERIPAAAAAVTNEKPGVVRIKAIRMALRLFQRMNKMPYHAHNTMRRYGRLERVKKLVFPKPDERFATAIIKVLLISSKHLDPTTLANPDVTVKHMHPHPHIQTKISAASASKMYAETEEVLRKRGQLPKGWTEQLQFVAYGIIKAGMNIPPALRHLFLGRFDEAASPVNKEQGVLLRVVPWAYSAERKKSSWHPWIVPSIRTRGLVVNKMTRTQRARFHRKRQRRSVWGGRDSV
ncbi:hypothetical protein C0995_015572 [Termitomyces sp. Mi166|nr:hypothetical protein C0995_015572 [Termitomyces sp. Mi166\